MKRVDIEKIVSRANLHYDGVVRRSEGGLPIGNGVMASLVWTSPTAIKLQINRCDVYSNGSATNSFQNRHEDYGYGCAFVDIDFADFSEDLFGPDTCQTLDIYRAKGSIRTPQTQTDFFACENVDAFCFTVKDDRHAPESICIRLKCLRDMEVRQRSQLALSCFYKIGDVIVLRQTFTEDDYYCASAVAVKVVGKKTRIRFNNETGGDTMGIEGRRAVILGMETEREMRLCVEPMPGEFDIFIASCASFDPKKDVAGMAADAACRAALIGRAQLAEYTQKVWRAFWDKSYIELWGCPEAEMVEVHYQYFMYVMGACSKNGKYPPNYGGMLFLTRGDPRLWGAQQWWNNLSLYYNPIMASGHYELVMPYFSMYNLMLDKLRIYARQQWDSQGVFIPETMGFDGPEVLPDDLAQEMSQLMLEEKPWDQKSGKFWKTALKKRPHEARWNFIGVKTWEKGELTVKDRGLYAAVTHMMGSQVGVAYTYWEYYQYSGDTAYLREHGYPIISGVADFFAHYKNVRRDEDGLYHIYGTNCSENYYGSKDSMESLLAMHVIFPVAIRAAEILGIDAEKAEKWQEMYRHLAPLPTTAHPDFQNDAFNKEDPIWINAVGKYQISAHDPVDHYILSMHSTPAKFGDICTLETQYARPDLYETGRRWMEYKLQHGSLTDREMVSEMAGTGRVLAHFGLREELAVQIVNQLKCINASIEYCSYDDNGRIPVFENRLTAREGVNALSAQRLGNCATAIQQALLQSSGGTPEADGVLWIFPALPANWNARFRLFAKDGFRVESECAGGEIGEVTIRSDLGRCLRVRCPYKGAMDVSVNNTLCRHAVKDLFEIDTNPGDEIVLTPSTLDRPE